MTKRLLCLLWRRLLGSLTDPHESVKLELSRVWELSDNSRPPNDGGGEET